MRPIFQGCLLLILGLAAFGCDDDPSSPPISKPVLTSNPLKSAKDSAVHRIVAPYAEISTTAGFSLAIIESTEVLSYFYGETVLGNGRIPDSLTVYEIGSLTKTFTAAALLLSLRERNIDTSAYVETILPAAAFGLTLNGTKTTFRELLNHTSGLPRLPQDLALIPGFRNDDPYAGYDSARIMSYLATHAPMYTPGTPPSASGLVEAYSNLAYGLAGILLERLNSASFNDVIEQRLCTPLGMTATTTAIPSSNAAVPHNERGGQVAWWNLNGFAGAGALHSNLHDMIRYLQAHLGLHGPSLQDVFATCRTPTVAIDGRDVFGLGWEFFYLRDGTRVTVKDGGTGGSTSFIALRSDRQTAIVFLLNNGNTSEPSECFIQLMESFLR